MCKGVILAKFIKENIKRFRQLKNLSNVSHESGLFVDWKTPKIPEIISRIFCLEISY